MINSRITDAYKSVCAPDDLKEKVLKNAKNADNKSRGVLYRNTFIPVMASCAVFCVVLFGAKSVLNHNNVRNDVRNDVCQFTLLEVESEAADISLYSDMSRSRGRSTDNEEANAVVAVQSIQSSDEGQSSGEEQASRALDVAFELEMSESFEISVSSGELLAYDEDGGLLAEDMKDFPSGKYTFTWQPDSLENNDAKIIITFGKNVREYELVFDGENYILQ